MKPIHYLSGLLVIILFVGISFDILKLPGSESPPRKDYIARLPETPVLAGRSKLGAPALYPNPDLTPGVILTTNQKKVCASGYASSVRNVPQSEKDAVYKEYGITSHTLGQYEIDHFVSLELGGSNDIKNLWPELNDHPKGALNSKDLVENWLHDQVCRKGTMTLQEAQRQISTDWYKVLVENGL